MGSIPPTPDSAGFIIMRYSVPVPVPCPCTVCLCPIPVPCPCTMSLYRVPVPCACALCLCRVCLYPVPVPCACALCLRHVADAACTVCPYACTLAHATACVGPCIPASPFHAASSPGVRWLVPDEPKGRKCTFWTRARTARRPETVAAVVPAVAVGKGISIPQYTEKH